MAYNDLQTSLAHNWKRTNHEHPIDQIFTGHFNGKTSPSHPRSSTYKSETNHLIQRQRVIRSFLNKPLEENEPSIRKPTTLNSTPTSLSITSISSPQVLFAQLNESNNNRQATIKKDLDHTPSLLTRRQRPTIEYPSPLHQLSDINNLSANQITIAVPQNYTFRHKPSRSPLSDRPSFKLTESISSPRLKPLHYSKTINENTLKHQTSPTKSIQQNPSHIWTPRLYEPTSPSRTLSSVLHAKSHLSKHLRNHPRQSLLEKINHHHPKTSYIQNLYISSQALTNPSQEYDMNRRISKKRFPLDEYSFKVISSFPFRDALQMKQTGDSKSNHETISDEDDSISADGNSSTSTCNSRITISQSDHSTQHDLFSYPHYSSSEQFKSKTPRLSIKRTSPRRRVYNIALPPVAEHLDGDETGDEV